MADYNTTYLIELQPSQLIPQPPSGTLAFCPSQKGRLLGPSRSALEVASGQAETSPLLAARRSWRDGEGAGSAPPAGRPRGPPLAGRGQLPLSGAHAAGSKRQPERPAAHPPPAGDAGGGLAPTYQVNECQKFPAASVGLVRGHVDGLVIAQDGEVREEDGDAQHLAGHERHVALPFLQPKAWSGEGTPGRRLTDSGERASGPLCVA